MTDSFPMPQTARQPDILEVIADLSNDEVFTPPKVANAVLFVSYVFLVSHLADATILREKQ